MRHRTLLISIALILVVIGVACGGTAAEPTAVTPATATPAPTRVPRLAIITASPGTDIEGFLAQMPEADRNCLANAVDSERFTAIVTGSAPEDSERDAIAGCLSNRMVAGFLVGQTQAGLGSFSGSSMECVISLLDQTPEGAFGEFLLASNGPPTQQAVQVAAGFMECLTTEEAAVVTRLGLVGTGVSSESDGTSSATDARTSDITKCLTREFGQAFVDGFGDLGGGTVKEFTTALEACGVGPSFDGLIAKLNAPDRTYTVQDLADAGFKMSKAYDVDGLEGATEAHYGFYGLDTYARLEYEARFYPSHAEARDIGVDFANEVTGADAVILKDVQRWQEGLTARRSCAGGGGHNTGRCDRPKYFDYVVVGNMVLLCQGKDTLASLQACADLMDVVE